MTPGLNPGQSTVTDSVGGRDGIDSLTNVEIIEFSNAYQMNQRNLDISPLTNLVPGRQIFGTDLNNAGIGDNLTIGLNGSGRTIDLRGGGTDTLILASSGFYSINLLNTEAVASTTTGPTKLNLQSTTTNTSVTLGNSFNDVLTLANGTNIVSVANVETVNGGGGIDTVTIGAGVTSVTTVNDVENIFGSGGMDNVILMASPNPLINANLDLGGGTDSVALNVFGATVNLTLTDVETVTSAGGASAVNLTNAANGLDIDLGTGFQTLNLASTGNVVTVRNVETLNAFGSANDTVTFFKEASIVNQTINLGFGTERAEPRRERRQLLDVPVGRQRLHGQRPDQRDERERQRAQPARGGGFRPRGRCERRGELRQREQQSGLQQRQRAQCRAGVR